MLYEISREKVRLNLIPPWKAVRHFQISNIIELRKYGNKLIKRSDFTPRKEEKVEKQLRFEAIKY